MVKKFVPHDQLTPGFWYIRVQYKPYYEIVKLHPFVFGPYEGQMGVWSIDHEGNNWIEDYAHDQFIGPVPPPEGLK